MSVGSRVKDIKFTFRHNKEKIEICNVYLNSMLQKLLYTLLNLICVFVNVKVQIQKSKSKKKNIQLVVLEN